jgi:hypothetical protein
MQAFDLIEMAELVGMEFAKVKNWTVDRPFTIHPSVYRASGRGSINLYSIQDVYLMAVAGEFSKAGFAAVAIGKLVAAIQVKFLDLDTAPILTVWRLKAGAKFEITEGRHDPADAILWITLNTPKIVRGINQKAEKMHKGPQVKPQQSEKKKQ